MIDWPISHYPDDMVEIKLMNGQHAYIFFKYHGYGYGVRELRNDVYVTAEWGATGKLIRSDNTSCDLIPPKREVERWYVWDHDCSTYDDNPIAVSDPDDFISKYGGTKVKVMITHPDND